MQKSTIKTLDLEKLSISARDFIESLSLDGFTLEQIKTLCKDRETELSKEVHSFLCKENKYTNTNDNTEADNTAEASPTRRRNPMAKITLTSKCPFCGTERQKEFDEKQYRKYQAGVCVQDAMPDASPDDREFLITGICPECWDKHLGGGEN